GQRLGAKELRTRRRSRQIQARLWTRYVATSCRKSRLPRRGGWFRKNKLQRRWRRRKPRNLQRGNRSECQWHNHYEERATRQRNESLHLDGSSDRGTSSS